VAVNGDLLVFQIKKDWIGEEEERYTKEGRETGEGREAGGATSLPKSSFIFLFHLSPFSFRSGVDPPSI
jgi:hypothetical protein